MRTLDLIVFSHLRWGFVYQRPQHLLSRLAASRRVLFIEEPIPGASGEAHWEIETPAPNVTVCRLHTSSAAPGFSDEQIEWLQPAVRELVDQQGFENYAAWFYTPMALPLLESIEPRGVVYDCMDQLSAFMHAPPALIENERKLLSIADLVFTGGPSLYREKKDKHPSVYCFSSSVDAAHFASARESIDLQQAPDQEKLARPRLGYFGVIDERIDLPLISELALARPEWQIVMVGPVVKIDPATLPRHPNLHYLGSKKYEELPSYLAGWDVCLMPFARNEATRFISPTKTLEYMAAEKPIVSTPITDVEEPYGHIVYLADCASSFERACQCALTESQEEKQSRIEKMREVLSRTSWDATARQMAALVDRLGSKDANTSADALDRKKDLDPTASNDIETISTPVAVIGAGPTGLSAGYHLGDKAIVLERNDTVGGWCRSLEIDGFTFDFAGHIMFSNDPYVHEMYGMLLGDNVHWQDREAWIYSQDVFTRYPYQGALYGLPPQTIKECIIGAIEARFGSLKTPAANSGNGSSQKSANGSANGHSSEQEKAVRNGNGHCEKAAANGNGNGLHATATNRLASIKPARNGNAPASNGNVDVKDCCADGVLESTAPLIKPQSNGHSTKGSGPRNFEEFIYQVWGSGIAKHFAIPYNQKLWAVPLSEMETSWLGGRVPLPDLEEMIEGALSPVGKPMGPNARFGYPLKGGFQALMNGFLPHLQEQLSLNSAIVGFSPSRHELTVSGGRRINYDCLISTMPLPLLVKMAGDEAPAQVRQAASRLRYISVRCVHIGVGRENLTEKHWIYYPGDTVFHRIFVQGNASPHCNPPGGFGLTCEITYHNDYKPLPCDGEELVYRCVNDCRRVGLINEDDPIWVTAQVDLPHAYVVYDHERAANVALIRDWLLEHDVILAGRYSEWEYYNSDHAFLAGKKAADQAMALLSLRETVK